MLDNHLVSVYMYEETECLIKITLIGAMVTFVFFHNMSLMAHAQTVNVFLIKYELIQGLELRLFFIFLKLSNVI